MACAKLSVIGELLTLGADRSATANTKRQTALDTRLHHLFFALTGQVISTTDTIHFDVAEGFTFTVEADFFQADIFPLGASSSGKKD